MLLLVKSILEWEWFFHILRANGTIKNSTAKVRTPFDAMQSWFKIKPELFKISPDEFRAYAIDKLEQRGETWQLKNKIVYILAN